MSPAIIPDKKGNNEPPEVGELATHGGKTAEAQSDALKPLTAEDQKQVNFYKKRQYWGPAEYYEEHTKCGHK